MKTELGKAVDKYIKIVNQQACKDLDRDHFLRLGFINGANWKFKKMYSEDEVLEQLNYLMKMPSSELDKFTDDSGNITKIWFETIKKKSNE